ncbi:MAG: DUF167 domain-containing protein [Pseudomonadota bacterium]
MKLSVKVVPKASRSGVAGWLGETLKICVAAPPERGKANAAVEQVLAAALGVAPQYVRLAAGAAAARKIIEIDGLSEAEVRRRLTAHLRDETKSV